MTFLHNREAPDIRFSSWLRSCFSCEMSLALVLSHCQCLLSLCFGAKKLWYRQFTILHLHSVFGPWAFLFHIWIQLRYHFLFFWNLSYSILLKKQKYLQHFNLNAIDFIIFYFIWDLCLFGKEIINRLSKDDLSFSHIISFLIYRIMYCIINTVLYFSSPSFQFEKTGE